jgi:hypothetical protein
MNIAHSTARILGLGTLVLLSVTAAQAQVSLTDSDRSEIQALMSRYAQALGGCRAEEFANLFVPGTGYFASGFRGRMVGRRQLIELVESERHCAARGDAAPPARPGGANGPTVVIEAGPDGVRGVAELGMAEYQDQYVKTPQGWRFASRTVLLASEKAAGLDAHDLLAIQQLGGDRLGDNYITDDNGVPRLLNSGIAVSVSDGEVKGRAYLRDGGYDDEVYEETRPGVWRVKSSTHVAPQAL